MITVVNLTGQNLFFRTGAGSEARELMGDTPLPIPDDSARSMILVHRQVRPKIGSIGRRGQPHPDERGGAPVFAYTGVTGLPRRKKDVVYIVSPEVGPHVRGRRDVYYPSIKKRDNPVRGADGKLFAFRVLIQVW